MKLILANNIDIAMKIIDDAKLHLREQGIDQWQNGYPDYDCIAKDILAKRGYFLSCNDDILGYLCIDFDGEPAYETLRGTWHSNEKYVVMHRLALAANARGTGITSEVFNLVCELSIAKNIHNFRVDTDADNTKMQHILQKNGFQYCGTIWFDNSEKIAFDKVI
ncbi:GNAT family N-acetyltransferase [Candidatus Epulonipiscium viviparus]|uniref:GNAT family N-acetyltransferase n=1 Tax=Candidatus Epulonipiscium viviparus TaxID=420336 RepID=UPI0027380B0F|nr:GNAT family N-acetyltransferase [Candidatus Epulopiscium viviparus]